MKRRRGNDNSSRMRQLTDRLANVQKATSMTLIALSADRPNRALPPYVPQEPFVMDIRINESGELDVEWARLRVPERSAPVLTPAELDVSGLKLEGDF